MTVCKYVLKNSYIQGYFIPKKSEELFSFIQSNLEATAEQLFQRLVESKEKIFSMEMERSLKHMTRIVTKYFSNFIEAYDDTRKLKNGPKK